MASAAVRSITQNWIPDQRRALMASLTETQCRRLRERIRSELLSKRYEEHEATDAIQFVASRGQRGSSWGIAEYEAICLFGRDPDFVDKYRCIKNTNYGAQGAET